MPANAFAAGRDVGARHRARDGRDRADGQVDAAGGDHERHAERDEQRRRAVAQDVDEAAEQVPVLQPQREERRRERPGSAAAAPPARAVATVDALLLTTCTFSGLARDERAPRRRRWCRAGQLRDLPPVPQHDDPVGHPHHLLQLGGDEQHRHALGREVGHHLLDLRLGADVDAAGRLVEDQQPSAGSPATAPAAPSAGCRRTAWRPPRPGWPAGCPVRSRTSRPARRPCGGAPAAPSRARPAWRG